VARLTRGDETEGKRMSNNFEDFLQDKFIKQNPTVLDDDIPDAFDEWLQELAPEEWIEYGDEYKKEASR
jgi:wobble nucleotide-excising tRNase